MSNRFFQLQDQLDVKEIQFQEVHNQTQILLEERSSEIASLQTSLAESRKIQSHTETRNEELLQLKYELTAQLENAATMSTRHFELMQSARKDELMVKLQQACVQEQELREEIDQLRSAKVQFFI